ncbi:hypothetical protein C0992_003833 [Termitomyces sp. T32_za158]|nr:hypothetical protein C0992_003833 [Termitomyces sp. T32_za158]
MMRVFTMFVLEALVLTFITTPLVNRLYPHNIRKRTATENTVLDTTDNFHGSNFTPHVDLMSKGRFTVVLDRLEHIPAVMAFSQLFSPRMRHHPLSTGQKRSAISIEVLRLIELSDHASAVMKSLDSLLQADHLLAIIKMFGRLHALPITTAIDSATYDGLSESVIEHARNYGSDLIILPWLLPSVNTSYQHTNFDETSLPLAHNGPGKSATNMVSKPSARIHAHFIQSIFDRARADVAVYLDRNVDNLIQGNCRPHVFLPFFGGPDDRFALDFVAQLCEDGEISATVLRLFRKDRNEVTSVTQLIGERCADFEDTESDTADDMAWKYHTSISPSASSNVSLSRMELKKCVTSFPLDSIVREAYTIKQSGVRLLIVAGRSNHRLRTDMDLTELSNFVAEYGDLDDETKKTIGVVATAFVTSGSGDGVLVLQKAGCHLD